MRRAGGAVAALLGLLLLSSCAVTPPVLGGRPGDPTIPRAAGLFSDPEVEALLIRNDPESEAVASTLAGYRESLLATIPDVDPVSCRDSIAPLVLFARDATAEGTVFEAPPLFRDAPGADLLVAQVARRFPSPDEAAAFLAALRAARAGCPAYDSADGQHAEREVVDGDLAVDAVGVAIERTSAGETTSSFEWVLVHGNVAIALEAELLDDDDRAVLDALAEEYAARLTE
jgi:hypothetical protein